MGKGGDIENKENCICFWLKEICVLFILIVCQMRFLVRIKTDRSSILATGSSNRGGLIYYTCSSVY